MPHGVVFLDKGVVAWEEFASAELPDNHVRIKARKSLISTGTEGICLHRLFEPGTHWDEWVKYPFKTGYCMVGEVSETKSDKLQIGQRVVARVRHASETIIGGDAAFAVPDGVSDDDAAWFALATIGFMGAKAGGYKLGDSVGVVGAGPIGQMTLRWAISAGARHAVIIDTVAMRLEMAKRGGATATIAKIASEAKEDLKAACGGELPRVVTDSTGFAAVFADVLALPRDRGTVVLLGDTGTPSLQHLTPDVVRRGIEIHGAHVSHETAEWTERNIVELFFSLLQRGIFKIDGLNTHTFKAEDCVAAFDLTSTHRQETMGVLFDWS